MKVNIKKVRNIMAYIKLKCLIKYIHIILIMVKSSINLLNQTMKFYMMVNIKII